MTKRAATERTERERPEIDPRRRPDRPSRERKDPERPPVDPDRRPDRPAAR